MSKGNNMPETPFKQQVNFNTVILMVLLSVVGFFGKRAVDRLDEMSRVVTALELRQEYTTESLRLGSDQMDTMQRSINALTTELERLKNRTR